MSSTLIERLSEQAEDLANQGIVLIEQYSRLKYYYNERAPAFSYSKWGEILPEGKRLQVQLIQQMQDFSELVNVLTQKLPSKVENSTTSVEEHHFNDRAEWQDKLQDDKRSC